MLGAFSGNLGFPTDKWDWGVKMLVRGKVWLKTLGYETSSSLPAALFRTIHSELLSQKIYPPGLCEKCFKADVYPNKKSFRTWGHGDRFLLKFCVFWYSWNLSSLAGAENRQCFWFWRSGLRYLSLEISIRIGP